MCMEKNEVLWCGGHIIMCIDAFIFIEHKAVRQSGVNGSTRTNELKCARAPYANVYPEERTKVCSCTIRKHVRLHLMMELTLKAGAPVTKVTQSDRMGYTNAHRTNAHAHTHTQACNHIYTSTYKHTHPSMLTHIHKHTHTDANKRQHMTTH